MAAFRLVTIFLFGMVFGHGALAEKRVALVIGNAAYQSVPQLANPSNDATDISGKLKTMGFDVVTGLDLDLTHMRQTVRQFIGKLDGADMALFFYAGHGLQVNGNNYLAPVDAVLRSYNDLDFEAMQIDLVLSAMERSAKTNLIFLDACRDNPLAETLARSMGTRSTSVGRGLAKIGSGVGSLIAFSTQPGNVALDGEGRNSPFTTALLKHLGTPGESVTDELILVRRDVLDATGGKQVPWDNSSLTGPVVLVPKPKSKPETEAVTPATESPSVPSNLAEITYWDTIKDSSNEGFFRSYLEQFPDGLFARLAELKIASIRQTEAAKSAVQPVPNEAAKSTADEQAANETQVAALPQTSSEEPAVDPRKDGVLVRSIQEQLKRLGCAEGNPDGIWGPKTERGLRNYAKHVDVAALNPSPELLDKMKSGKEQVCPPGTSGLLASLNGLWIIQRVSTGDCGWKTIRADVQIKNGVFSGSDMKGHVSEKGRITLKGYWVQQGRTKSQSLNGTMDENGGGGTYRNDERVTGCKGRFTITRR